AREGDGRAESPRPAAINQWHERLPVARRERVDGRAHAQLSFVATDAQQTAQNEQRAALDLVSASSLSEADQRAALASGSGFANGKERIAAYYAGNHTQKERVEFLKQEYGTGGRSWTFQNGSNGFLDYDAGGVKLREYAHNREQVLKWPEVDKRIHVLIATGQYLDGPDKKVRDEKDTRTDGDILRETLA